MLVGVPKPGHPIGNDELVRFIHHTKPGVTDACGFTWGEMAPPANRPGMLHWCTRPDVDGEHRGRHRCTCGDYADDGAAVICRFPVDGGECGSISTGTERTVLKPRRTLRRDAPLVPRGEFITSVPCGHPVRRGTTE